MEKSGSSIEEVYAYAIPYNDDVQMEDEQKIYETPCENDDHYDPIYTKPPKAVEKIYETFEGKRFHKLYHQSIRYICNDACIVFTMSSANCFTELLRNLVQESLGLLHVVS